MVTYLAVYTESKNDSPAFSIWDTYQQALNSKVPDGMVLWDVIGIKDADRAKHQQNPAFIPAKEFPANRYDAEGVVYTGDYQTNDDYNPYKYVNEAPFGAEDDSLSKLAQREIKSLRQTIQHLEETGPRVDKGTESDPLGTASEASVYKWEQQLKSAKQRLYHLLDQRYHKEEEMCPDFAVDMNHCYLKKCKVCAKEGRTPEALQELLETGWFTRGPDGRYYQKGILDSDFGIQGHSRRPTMLPRKDDYNLGEYNLSERDAEEYPFEEVRKINYARLDAQKEQDPWAWDKEDTLIRLEPIENLNMKGVGGILLAIVGILLWQA